MAEFGYQAKQMSIELSLCKTCDQPERQCTLELAHPQEAPMHLLRIWVNLQRQ